MKEFVLWLVTNYPTLIYPVLTVLLASLVNGLTKYPKAQGILGFIKMLVDRLSVTTMSNSPGSLKLPLMASKDPAQAQADKDLAAVTAVKKDSDSVYPF